MFVGSLFTHWFICYTCFAVFVFNMWDHIWQCLSPMFLLRLMKFVIAEVRSSDFIKKLQVFCTLYKSFRFSSDFIIIQVFLRLHKKLQVFLRLYKKLQVFCTLYKNFRFSSDFIIIQVFLRLHKKLQVFLRLYKKLQIFLRLC